MKAFVYYEYGGAEVLELAEVGVPELGEGEVLVRVRASALGKGDWFLMTAEIWAARLIQGLFRPKRHVLGHEAAGVVEAVGGGVTGVNVGDEVFGTTDDGGSFAELWVISEGLLAAKPARLSFEEAAAIPVSAMTALHGLRDKGGIRAGHRVLINGASGGVGSYAIQVAKGFGAEVTAVCSTSKVELAKELGADHVIDYTRGEVDPMPGSFDIVLDIIGNWSIKKCRRLRTATGTYVIVGGGVWRSMWASMTGGKRSVMLVSKPKQEDLFLLCDWIETGKLKPVIDRTYPFEMLPDAMRYLGEGHARGKIVMRMPV